MTSEHECNCSQKESVPQNTRDTEKEHALLQATQKMRKSENELCIRSVEESIARIYKNGAAFLRIFDANGYCFDVFYSGARSRKSLSGKLVRHLLQIRLRLAQFVFPDSSSIRCTLFKTPNDLITSGH